ncbi:hypothetical protein C8A03DRAFT_19870 [Achaetomium macrosporum]|uniref:Uncharacterized protein n=1 Tax=Achaetomium macrosporum TaxID=79813 RepID=A0AAN7H9I8_9PEZI|nr:hypothetical protein C8A03DRAFT_19870 [Achaetomium macrosporum]
MSSDASLPLALHLCCELGYGFLTNEQLKPGDRYGPPTTISDLAFIDRYTGRRESTLIFASVLRAFYEHADWSQLHAFFTKRYGPTQILVNRGARKLTAPTDFRYAGREVNSYAGKKITANFKTDPSSVGLPEDLVQQLAVAGRASRERTGRPDPQPIAIGSALSIAFGGGGYMDLVYAGKPPGKYEADIRTEEATGKGGRAQSWKEWAELWSVVADWVYECDATLLENHMFDMPHSYKCHPTDEERMALLRGIKMSRKLLGTDAINAADAVRDVFKQLARGPTKFQGLEWDFLELKIDPHSREKFYTRFGRRDPNAKKTVEDLTKPVALDGRNRPVYDDVGPTELKQCPDTYNGLDWESWMLSIKGGDVIIAITPFQVSPWSMHD